MYAFNNIEYIIILNEMSSFKGLKIFLDIWKLNECGVKSSGDDFLSKIYKTNNA